MAIPSELRVVFTGHTGLKKSRVLSRFCTYIDSKAIGRKAKWYDADAQIEIVSFLDEHWKLQREEWKESLSLELDRWEREKPDYAFLSMHLSYQRYSRIFSPLSWHEVGRHRGRYTFEHPIVDLLKNRFRPHYFVTLIDDVMAVQNRIAPGFHFSLRELLSWRNLEMLLTDALAGQVISNRIRKNDKLKRPFERSPIIAVRHPRDMLYRYLFHSKDIPRVYLSFPISGPRTKQEFIAEIDLFRAAFHNEFTVFDPVTIDEKPLDQILIPKGTLFTSTESYTTFPADLRWNLDDIDTLIGDKFKTIKDLSIYEISEIVEGRLDPKTDRKMPSIVDYQVEERDYRLIDQADCVVFYRPQFGGVEAREQFSHGTGEEWRYARMHGKTRFIIHDSAVDGEFDESKAFRLKPSETPHLLSDQRYLSDPNNQQEVLQDVIKRIWKTFKKP